MSLSSIIQQTEEILDEVLRTIRQECEKPTSVLCETDRRDFVENEESLRKRLRETGTEESHWRKLFCISSPQAVKCLRDAKELRYRVKEDIRTKERTIIFGMGDPPSSCDHGQGPAINSMDARTPEADPGRLLADATSEPASSIITSPLNMRCSLTEASGSELIVYPQVARNDNDYTSDLNEAINTPLVTSSDRSRDSFGGGQRRSPPPPPPSRRMGQSTISRQTTSSSGSSRGSRPVRRPAAPPPPSTGQFSPGSPFNGSFPSLDPLSANLAMMSSMSELTQQAQRLRKLKRSEDYVTKLNCVDINGSNADGVTLNIGGSKNSGSVIHKTGWPQPIPV